jgi:hypothetical protein
MLSFQRPDVYQRVIELLALVYDLVDVLPRGHADRAGQLARAAEFVARNLAEGAGRWSEADSAKVRAVGPNPTAPTATRSLVAKPWSARPHSTS